VPDDIIDMVDYLKFAATHRLLTKRGKEKETDDRLSAVCLKRGSVPMEWVPALNCLSRAHRPSKTLGTRVNATDDIMGGHDPANLLGRIQ
jgi:hypothetical protein